MINIIASLAVFKELFDQKKDIYDVLSNFIARIIAEEQLYIFTSLEIVSKLKKHYEFNIPEAIIKTALKRLPLKLERGKYVVENKNLYRNESITDIIANANKNIDAVLYGLFKHIESVTRHNINETEKTAIREEFFKYLIDSHSSKGYTKYISTYLLSELDNTLVDSLNIIRQGLILYSGLNYEDINTLGYWKIKFTIYVDTEIIFHMAGYKWRR